MQISHGESPSRVETLYRIGSAEADGTRPYKITNKEKELLKSNLRISEAYLARNSKEAAVALCRL